jgi:signal transduction histidine kinase
VGSAGSASSPSMVIRSPGPKRVERALIAAFAAVVVSFVGASWFGQHRASEIEQAALSIQTNAAPSIRRLANARAELRRLQLLVHRALDESTRRERVLEISAGRQLLDEEIDEYRRLPTYPGENAAWRDAETSLARLDLDLTGIIEALERHDLDAAREQQERLDTASEALARTLSQAINLNVAVASALAAEIQQSRRRGIVWAVVLDAAGMILAGLAAALSLRASRAHSRSVQAYRELAETRAAELEQFAARLAHDVRTPLSVIKLSLGLAVKYGGPDPRFARASDRAHRALERTTGIIDALFEFARSGARPQAGVRASPVEAAQEVVDVMQERAQQIGAEIVVHGRTSSRVGCSSGVLEIVLENLVGNALNYLEGAPDRRVTIDVSGDGSEVTTVVADTGPGLPPDADMASLFEPYVRGQEARGIGLGLGLATVKRIVDAHGGRTGVRSSAKGCQFWFSLPAIAP